MKATPLKLAGLLVLEPTVFHDKRGFFLEAYRREILVDAGLDVDFVQDSHSHSRRGTIRGMHFQTTPGQAKLVRAGSGRIFDVVVDIRPDSKTFGHWESIELDAEDHRQLFVPIGFAHGFCVLSETADVLYKTSAPYDAATESGFKWNDPDVGIDWPIEDPFVSERDHGAQSFAELRPILKK